ncbi:MAG TPA: hypothetical protein VEB86_18225, partial [Chryseosolibacter sp.]|nr:hypothetical protein [Chryseosolibacter sp.]
MKIAVRATEQQKQEWLASRPSDEVELIWVESDVPKADAYFDLMYEDLGGLFTDVSAPVFVSAVIKTCDELAGRWVRFNGWPGFIGREVIE